MATADLTAQRLRELLSYNAETGQFTWLDRRKSAISRSGLAGFVVKDRYRAINIDGRRHFAHRLAWLYVTGSWPNNDIDHINCIPSDNRFCNLRDVSRRTNSENQRAGRRGGLIGTAYHKASGKWRALIGVDYKVKTLGYFETAEQAHARYLEAKRVLHLGNTL